MESLHALMRRVARLGVTLSTTPTGDLCYRAPRGALTADLRSALRAHKAELVELLRDAQSATAVACRPTSEACRRRAESAEDLRDVWAATVDEIALRWESADGRDELWLPAADDHRLQDEIGAALRAADRSRALLRIEEWRDAWLGVLGQLDLESSGRLNVIAALRERRGAPRRPVE